MFCHIRRLSSVGFLFHDNFHLRDVIIGAFAMVTNGNILLDEVPTLASEMMRTSMHLPSPQALIPCLSIEMCILHVDIRRFFILAMIAS